MDENSNLYKIRHSMAHVLAQAVQEVYPKVKLGFGPPIETGFYYDFDFSEEEFAENKLKEIEKRMKKIIGRKQEFHYSETDIEGAVAKLEDLGEGEYKIENVRNLHSRGVEKFSFYENGNFADLCEGPHVETTGDLPAKAFKLDRVAGAYWLGSEKNKQLTRIYALCFETPEELQSFLERRRIAEQFDHKKLGKELDIFHFDEKVGKGLALWMPNGTIIRDEIEKYAREMEMKYGYQRVSTPHIASEKLFQTSGHLPYYADSMFPPMELNEGDDAENSEKYYLKAMNCPYHHLIYSARPRSYKELPYRLCEYGTCYRYEKSGELSGLLRVRCMTMNDAHVYLTEDQFEEEFRSMVKMYMEFYETFKFSDYSFRLSVRDDSDKFVGDPAVWDQAEALLAKVMDELGLEYFVGEGEAAFYGPKIDVQFKNLMGREETLSTIQVDFQSACKEKFALKYVDSDNTEKEPIIIHRAPLSTHERFISFIMEYYGGAFPAWCAPVQVCILPVQDSCMEFTNSIANELTRDLYRVEIDDSNNTFNKKIRTNTKRKIPILLIIGEQEVADNTVTVRRYGSRDQITVSRDEFVAIFKAEVKERKMLREPMGSII
ncbi:threonyl-tRNA synthetase [Lentisphaera araneosa HTCC2155]|uniref:Threonine--tRNA ligase n=1 Tax=Lentisphaera araneosa HTCC2155 TaxID=313628 RepID=A6DTH1_9BACT|nr:threonine--tRNA ligase [Lentisphaera araneosa]EDM25075.1 threonyl-tRNA synthetase [Lentisphaera araneosa HTCC2155]